MVGIPADRVFFFVLRDFQVIVPLERLLLYEKGGGIPSGYPVG